MAVVVFDWEGWLCSRAGEDRRSDCRGLEGIGTEAGLSMAPEV